MQMKKHISALVCVAITCIMLFGVQQLESSYSVQEKLGMGRMDIQSLFYEVQMQWNTYLKRFLQLTQAVAGLSHDTF